jgi:DNA-binding HxlR family transcriptional regulator
MHGKYLLCSVHVQVTGKPAHDRPVNDIIAKHTENKSTVLFCSTFHFEAKRDIMTEKEMKQMKKSESAINRCKTISTVQKLLSGKYKIEILWYIGKCDVRRFGQLRRQIGEITESSLTKQLRELESDGFILRHDFCEVPPRVEYSLTELGQSFLPVLDYMKVWGDKNLSV